MPLIWERTYRSDTAMDFHERWLKRRGLAQGCAFLGFIHMAAHLLGQKTQNPNYGAWIGVFKPNSRNCIDSNQILHSDKDHQMPFVGGPHTRIRNPRWRTADILEKSKVCYILAAVQAILTKFGTQMQFDPLDHFDRKKIEISKIQDGGGRHLEK